MDATRLEADAIGSDLRLQLTVVGAPPPTLLSAMEEVAFVFGLDTDGDATPEYLISFANRDDGSWAASLEDQHNGDRLEGSTFPGSIVLQERVVLVQIALSGVGSPSSMRVCAVTQSVVPVDGHVAARDNAPDGDCRLGTPTLPLQ